MNVRKVITVNGCVQGVAFRYHTQKRAVDMGVKGWVRNLPNGDVEVCMEGDEESVRSMVEWCRNGPPAARVERLTLQDRIYSGEFVSFEIRY